MSFAISSLELYQFRNYQHLSLDGLGRVMVFVGENGVGKTNILEALHLITACQSFRHASIEELMMEGCEDKQASIKAVFDNGSRNRDISLFLVPGKRQYRMNGKARPSTEIKGLAPSVAFTPDDLLLIKGSQSQRRGALDMLGEQLRPGYQSVRLDFAEVLRHKNKLLKEGYGAEYLAAINDMMVTCGAQLTFYRSSLFDKLAPRIIDQYQRLSSRKECLTCEYIPSWESHGNIMVEGVSTADDQFADDSTEIQDIVLEADSQQPAPPTEKNFTPRNISRDFAREMTRQALNNRLDDEVIRQRSIIGPHMDTINFFLDGKNASVYASQGQQRSIILAWKLAEVDLINELLCVSPILLLDDVMSELDESRRIALEECIDLSSQTFITTTNLGYFSDEMVGKSTIINLPLL